MTKFESKTGNPFPLGASKNGDFINFAIVSTDHKALSLCLFDPDHSPLLTEINLDPATNKTGNVWHIAVKGFSGETKYAYRTRNEQGVPSHYLLDPYAKEVTLTDKWNPSEDRFAVEHRFYSPLGYPSGQEPFDWEGVKSPNIPLKDLVIYEMHVRGYTRDSSSGVKNPGTYSGVIEKIPHLLEMGINAVELMPIHEFNKQEYLNRNPITKQKLCNYWGYSTVNFFSPMSRYASTDEKGKTIQEFKTMIRELHRNGIEVILDVVFNHTFEGNAFGPKLSYKALANNSYYIVDKDGHYQNYTGCGNTFNCNHPITMKLILDSLRYWVSEMHVDGFRFDLASIFMRDTSGNPMAQSPIVNAISEDPLLANVKLIAEPWDAAGLYQVGAFWPHRPRWSEWNGKYRDCVRKFIKGTSLQKGEFAGRLTGSQDLYGSGRTPNSSINFITAHDGFTLRDLVSYNEKHNKANGEENRDGTNDNESWNCGAEGKTDDPEVLKLRERQIRNLHLALMISQGVPMILMTDEYGHTRDGNNNAWCQDNKLNWFLWDELKKNEAFYRFFKKMIHFRKEHSILKRGDFLSDKEISWHGVMPLDVKWQDDDKFIACTLYDQDSEEDLYIAFNASDKPVKVTLPAPKRKWAIIADTARESPNDFPDQPILLEATEMEMIPYSAVILGDLKPSE